MKKSIVSILLAKAPHPDKLRKRESESEDEPDTDASDDDEGADEGNDAAGESATGDFIAAIGHKNPVAAWKAFKEMCSLCGGASDDEGDESGDDYDRE